MLHQNDLETFLPCFILSTEIFFFFLAAVGNSIRLFLSSLLYEAHQLNFKGKQLINQAVDEITTEFLTNIQFYHVKVSRNWKMVFFYHLIKGVQHSSHVWKDYSLNVSENIVSHVNKKSFHFCLLKYAGILALLLTCRLFEN